MVVDVRDSEKRTDSPHSILVSGRSATPPAVQPSRLMEVLE